MGKMQMHQRVSFKNKGNIHILFHFYICSFYYYLYLFFIYKCKFTTFIYHYCNRHITESSIINEEDHRQMLSALNFKLMEKIR